MQKIQHSIFINAPVEKVWDTMLGDATYREWTKPFDSNSSFEGNWSEGSTMKFLGIGENGETHGMYSTIAVNRQYEFVSIKHLGMIDEIGNIDTENEEMKKWELAYENYTFTPKDGGTELTIELDIADEYKDMIDGMWPPALQALKEIAER